MLFFFSLFGCLVLASTALTQILSALFCYYGVKSRQHPRPDTYTSTTHGPADLSTLDAVDCDTPNGIVSRGWKTQLAERRTESRQADRQTKV